MDDRVIQRPRMYKKGRAAQKAARLYVVRGAISVDSGAVAGWWRTAPTPIAVHRRGGKKICALCVFSTRTRSLPIDSIYAYPHFRNNPFAPTL